MQIQRKVQELEREIQHHKKACQSPWPQPSDYTNLIDAQYALSAIREEDMAPSTH